MDPESQLAVDKMLRSQRMKQQARGPFAGPARVDLVTVGRQAARALRLVGLADLADTAEATATAMATVSEGDNTTVDEGGLGADGHPAAAAGPGDPPWGADDQLYFDSYGGDMTVQQDMLSDEPRMRGYHDAILGNAAAHFAGKVVLDVGAGTGPLSVWAAQAGAARVYAVEASTAAAAEVKAVAAEHGFGDVITVLHGLQEPVRRPQPVHPVHQLPACGPILRAADLESIAANSGRQRCALSQPGHFCG